MCLYIRCIYRIIYCDFCTFAAKCQTQQCGVYSASCAYITMEPDQQCKFYAKIIILQFNSLHWGKFSRHVCAAAIPMPYFALTVLRQRRNTAHTVQRDGKFIFIPFVCHINGFYLRYCGTINIPAIWLYVDLMVVCLVN